MDRASPAWLFDLSPVTGGEMCHAEFDKHHHLGHLGQAIMQHNCGAQASKSINTAEKYSIQL